MRARRFAYWDSVWRELALVGLAALSVALLVYELSEDLLPHQVALIRDLDLAISLVFLADFAVGFYLADDKKAYLKSDWYLLLASIPLTEGVIRAARSVRALRLIRLVRVIARVRKMADLANKAAPEGDQYIYAASISTVVVFSGAVAFFTVEADVNPDIETFFDAIWWSVVTTTTVGYGDIYPVTTTGRLVAIVLMIFGIGLVGSVAGLVGGYVLRDRVRAGEQASANND